MSKTTYKNGQWNAQCDVCGFEYKSSQLRKRWDGLMVCKVDWEARHPMDSFRPKTDDSTTPWSRVAGAEAAGTDVSGNTTSPAINGTTTTTVPPGTFDGSL